MPSLWDLASPVLGGVIAFSLQHYWHLHNRGHERRQRRRENAEKLGTLVFECLAFMVDHLRSVMADVPNSTHDPMAAAWAMQELHFPELRDAFVDFTEFRHKHLEFIHRSEITPEQWRSEVYWPAVKATTDFIAHCRRVMNEN